MDHHLLAYGSVLGFRVVHSDGSVRSVDSNAGTELAGTLDSIQVYFLTRDPNSNRCGNLCHLHRCLRLNIFGLWEDPVHVLPTEEEV